MEFLTNDKLVIVGAAGMIGSNMVQTALMLRLTPNICLYDVFSAEGVAEEMRQCGFDDANIVSTTDPKEAFTGAKYIISSGGAPRKEGMTREDLLVGNSKAAEELGQNIKKFCPDAKFCVVIFNPADITGLVTLVHSGLKPNQVATLAALDSTRLKGALAKHFGVSQAVIENAYTYGGHGEKMAVFASPTTIDGVKLLDVIAGKATVNGKGLTAEEWATMQKEVTQGGAKIIELRRRSSFQSPSYLAVKMIEAAMGGEEFTRRYLCRHSPLQPRDDGYAYPHLQRRCLHQASYGYSRRVCCSRRFLQPPRRYARPGDCSRCSASSREVV